LEEADEGPDSRRSDRLRAGAPGKRPQQVEQRYRIDRLDQVVVETGLFCSAPIDSPAWRTKKRLPTPIFADGQSSPVQHGQ